VAEASFAFARAQMGVHASSPVGHLPDSQSWAAPGAPLMPSHAHCQQPHSVADVQAPPGAVLPGSGPVVVELEQPAPDAIPSTPQRAKKAKGRRQPAGSTRARR
jgi:hypothetical protein